MPPHKSDSAVQREAESEMLARLATRDRLDFSDDRADSLKLKGVKPDGVDWSKRVLVEAYARVGVLKGGQPHKVKGDILKLVYLERMLGGTWRKILCFGDETAARSVSSGSRAWIAAAAREFGVDVVDVPHSDEMKQRLLECQRRQRMVNED